MDAETSLLIVYHSQSGNTEQLAAAVEEGARRVSQAKVSRLPAARIDSGLLQHCAVLVICSPEYFGYMAGAIKDFFDRTYEQTREFTIGKPYVVVISAGNDGTGALTSIERIVAGYRMRKVQEPIIHRGKITEDALSRCRELGQTLAAGIDLGIY
jgi:multimeric flavodoxin WrbA